MDTIYVQVNQVVAEEFNTDPVSRGNLQLIRNLLLLKNRGMIRGKGPPHSKTAPTRRRSGLSDTVSTVGIGQPQLPNTEQMNLTDPSQ